MKISLNKIKYRSQYCHRLQWNLLQINCTFAVFNYAILFNAEKRLRNVDHFFEPGIDQWFGILSELKSAYIHS